MIEVILDIEKALKMDTLPPPNPRQEYQSSEIDRFFHLLKEYAKREEEKAAINPKDKVKNPNIKICYLVLLCFSYPCFLWVSSLVLPNSLGFWFPFSLINFRLLSFM
jgi:hypothetical protein